MVDQGIKRSVCTGDRLPSCWHRGQVRTHSHQQFAHSLNIQIQFLVQVWSQAFLPMGSLCQGYKYLFIYIQCSSQSKPHEKLEREDIWYPDSLWAVWQPQRGCPVCCYCTHQGQLHWLLWVGKMSLELLWAARRDQLELTGLKELWCYQTGRVSNNLLISPSQ